KSHKPKKARKCSRTFSRLSKLSYCEEHQIPLGKGYWDSVTGTMVARAAKEGEHGLRMALKEWKAMLRSAKNKNCQHCILEILIHIRYREFLILKEQARYLE